MTRGQSLPRIPHPAATTGRPHYQLAAIEAAHAVGRPRDCPAATHQSRHICPQRLEPRRRRSYRSQPSSSFRRPQAASRMATCSSLLVAFTVGMILFGFRHNKQSTSSGKLECSLYGTLCTVRMPLERLLTTPPVLQAVMDHPVGRNPTTRSKRRVANTFVGDPCT